MGKPLRLLIIEDVEEHALLIVRELQKGGFDISYQRVATVQALEAALDDSLHAIISDFRLSSFNALDALDIVKAKGLDLPFIIVSGVMGEETAVEAMKAGAHDFLLKGKYARLSSALERELHEAALRREKKLAMNELLQAHEEVKQQRAELEIQHEKLLEAHHRLEEETARRLQAMEELRQKDQLLIQQNRMAAMGEMLNNIAHQWRQPLNLLGLKIQELPLTYHLGIFNKELLESNVAKSMEIIQRMSKTIDDFRIFTALEGGKSQFGVSEIFAKTIPLIEDSFRQHGVVVDVRICGNPEILGYPNEYRQVLLNILTNAKEALLEQQKSDARILVLSWEENGKTVVTIADNAGGIKEEIMDRIFDAYFTTKVLGKGTGIGLFMAKTIIENNMGGCLTVRNVEQGAEFRIEV